MRRVCLALLLLLPLMLLPALGAEVSFSQADELLEAAEDYGVDPQASLETGVQGILQAGLDQLGEMLRRSLGTGIKLLAVALLCGLAEGTALDQSREGLNAVMLHLTGRAWEMPDAALDGVEVFAIRADSWTGKHNQM